MQRLWYFSINSYKLYFTLNENLPGIDLYFIATIFILLYMKPFLNLGYKSMYNTSEKIVVYVFLS